MRSVGYTHLVNHDSHAPNIQLRCDYPLLCEYLRSYIAIRPTALLHLGTFSNWVHDVSESKITELDFRELMFFLFVKENVG